MMAGENTIYNALLSTDWNQCLAPCGPFDALTFHYPHCARDLETLFTQYTGNRITLGEATRRIGNLVPGGLTPEQMDAYLDRAFDTYQGVAGLIRWCHDHKVLFMVNTTGMIGYFQRILARDLLPPLPVAAAHPLIRFDAGPSDPPQLLILRETADKAVHTAAVAERFGIEPRKIFLMGDSGGDGPHFEWGARVGAHLIGSMTKPSLQRFCRERGISIDHFVGHTYAPGELVSPEKETAFDFLGISRLIRAVIP